MNSFTFDYNFAVEKHLANGITKEALSKYQEKVKVGIARLSEMVTGGSVGFPNLPLVDVSDITSYAKSVNGKYEDVIIAGIGGSALGIEAVVNAILPYGYNTLSEAERGYKPKIWVADNVDPSKIVTILSMCKPEKTLCVVISKSGNTVETAQNFSLIFDWFGKLLAKNMREHIVVVTDPAKGPLREFADKNNLVTFPIEASVGGRFSVLSPVGLVPAALIGVDIEKLLLGAKDIVDNYQYQIEVASAIYLYYMDNGKSINVLMPYSSRLDKYAEWFCQLWGESLGKKLTYSGKEITFGSTPVRAVGAIDQHSQIQLFREGPLDKVVTFVEVKQHDKDKSVSGNFYDAFGYLNGLYLGKLLNTELQTTEAALLTSGVPSLKISIDTLDEFSLGQLFMFMQYIVPIIGLAVDINPFDQPGVEEAKEYAYGLMDRAGFEAKKQEFHEIYKKDDEFII